MTKKNSLLLYSLIPIYAFGSPQMRAFFSSKKSFLISSKRMLVFLRRKFKPRKGLSPDQNCRTPYLNGPVEHEMHHLQVSMNSCLMKIDTPLDKSLQEWLQKDKQLLIIPGLGHEFSQSHSNKIKNMLEADFQIPVCYQGFPSKNFLHDNSQDLKDLVQKLYTLNKRSIIILGNSKGGLEAFNLIMLAPELLEEGMVHSVILMQSPVKGSSWLSQNLESHCIQIAKFFFAKPFHGLLPSSSEKRIMKIQNKIKQSASFDENLSKKIFYVQAAQKFDQIRFHLFLFLNVFPYKIPPQIPNDGVLSIHEQKCEDFGIDLGIIQEDHLFLYSAKDEKKIKAFMRMILKEMVLSQ